MVFGISPVEAFSWLLIILLLAMVAATVGKSAYRMWLSQGVLFHEDDTDMYEPVLLMDSVYEQRWRVKAEKHGYFVNIAINDTHGFEVDHIFEMDIDDLEVDAYDRDDLVRTLRREVEGFVTVIQQDRKWEDA